LFPTLSYGAVPCAASCRVLFWAHIKNTEKYINIERKIFADYADDEYTVKVASEQHEAAMLLEQGFEWVGVKENLIFFRKRK
jgi:hypothetical protein